MRQGVTLHFVGSKTGFEPATLKFGPETPLDEQIDWARTYLRDLVAGDKGAKGYPEKIEIWTENAPLKRYLGEHPGGYPDT